MKKMLMLLIILFAVSTAYADITSTALSSATSSPMPFITNNAGLGFLNSGGISAPVFSWNPDFNSNGVSLGLTVNIPVNNSTATPVKVDTVVLRYLEYTCPAWGLRYGAQNNVTIGNGLLMSNYSTTSNGGIIQSGQQSGLKGYYSQDIYKLEYLATWSKVFAVRLSEKVLPYLTLGQYFVGDSDGVTLVRSGTTVNYPAQSGCGLDAEVPFIPGSFLFAEYAHMNNHGSGISAGLNAAYDFLIGRIGFKAEKRYVDYNFVPGYFNEVYETDPIDIASYESVSTNKDGYRVQLTGDILRQVKFYGVLEGRKYAGRIIHTYCDTEMKKFIIK